MNSLWKNALIASLAFTATACGTENRGLESVHQPVVRRADYVMDVPAFGAVASTDQQRVADWLAALQPRYGDTIAIDRSRAADAGQSTQVIAAMIGDYGLRLAPVAPITEGQIPDGYIRIVLSRMTADVPGCPDWSRSAQPNFDGHSLSNYGCATNGNLAAMVANPADLVVGRSGRTTDGTAQTGKAVKALREAAPTGASGLKPEGTDK